MGQEIQFKADLVTLKDNNNASAPVFGDLSIRDLPKPQLTGARSVLDQIDKGKPLKIDGTQVAYADDPAKGGSPNNQAMIDQLRKARELYKSDHRSLPVERPLPPPSPNLPNPVRPMPRAESVKPVTPEPAKPSPVNPNGTGKEVVEKVKPKLLYFGAEWCGPCRQLKPQVEALQTNSNYKGLDVKFYNADESAETMARYGVAGMGIPVMVLLDNKGQKVAFDNKGTTAVHQIPRAAILRELKK